jgi:hypothetical protein
LIVDSLSDEDDDFASNSFLNSLNSKQNSKTGGPTLMIVKKSKPLAQTVLNDT